MSNILRHRHSRQSGGDENLLMPAPCRRYVKTAPARQSRVGKFQRWDCGNRSCKGKKHKHYGYNDFVSFIIAIIQHHLHLWNRPKIKSCGHIPKNSVNKL
jgi:hypothetical protein